jgi:hypothetical protein
MTCSNCGVEGPEEAVFCPRCGTQLKSNPAKPPLFSIHAPHEYAGFWARYFAYSIDSIILGAPLLVAAWPFVTRALTWNESELMWAGLIGNLAMIPPMSAI